jgi:hypothetical protein
MLAAEFAGASLVYASSSAVIKARTKKEAKEPAEQSADSKCMKMTGLSRTRCLKGAGRYNASASREGGVKAADPIRERLQKKKAGAQFSGAGASAEAGAADGAAQGGGARTVSGGAAGGGAAAALGGLDAARAQCMKVSLMTARADCLKKLSAAAKGGGAADAGEGAAAAGGGGTLKESPQTATNPNRFKIGTPETGAGGAVTVPGH